MSEPAPSSDGGTPAGRRAMPPPFGYRLGMARCRDIDERRAFLRTFRLGVKLMRVGQGLSQQALSSAAGLHRRFIGRLERGENGVKVADLPQLARALGVPPRELIPQPEDVSPQDVSPEDRET